MVARSSRLLCSSICGPMPSFLDHVPTALSFGTSGLRGLVKDITDLEAYINVVGALRYLIDAKDIEVGSTVVLGGDLRPSTDRILRACAQAIVDVGCVVENVGKLPSPALALHALENRRAGVMVTGSHIPFDRNGIKINRSASEVLKSDEAGITGAVGLVRAAQYAKTAETSAFDAKGMLKSASALPLESAAAVERYVARYVGSFPANGLSGLRVLFYEHSAVGRELLPRILRALGAEVVCVGRAEVFTPIDTENVTSELLARLEALVAAAPENKRIDALVSTDGDSDRPLVTAVLEGPDARGERVRFLPGDLLGIVVAEYLRADAVAVPISANDAVETRLRERGVRLSKTRIGSPYVIAAIDEIRATGDSQRVVGWEANGGFLVGSALTLDAGTLAPLPTRDATLPILANLFAAKSQSLTLAELWQLLPARFGASGLIDEVPVVVSKAILAQLVPPGDVREVDFTRADSDARIDDAWRASKASLERFFTPVLGFDEIASINVLDGVRVRFRNGDVAHIRPSGNAPQLRIYANASSQARADAIVAAGLREPDGILRTLERAFS